MVRNGGVPYFIDFPPFVRVTVQGWFKGRIDSTGEKCLCRDVTWGARVTDPNDLPGDIVITAIEGPVYEEDGSRKEPDSWVSENVLRTQIASPMSSEVQKQVRSDRRKSWFFISALVLFGVLAVVLGQADPGTNWFVAITFWVMAFFVTLTHYDAFRKRKEN